jgi:hypothetical protein
MEKEDDSQRKTLCSSELCYFWNRLESKFLNILKRSDF